MFHAAWHLAQKKPLNPEIVKKVKDFYLSEENSRIMPGKKDCISIKLDEGRINV